MFYRNNNNSYYRDRFWSFNRYPSSWSLFNSRCHHPRSNHRDSSNKNWTNHQIDLTLTTHKDLTQATYPITIINYPTDPTLTTETMTTKDFVTKRIMPIRTPTPKIPPRSPTIGGARELRIHETMN